MEQEKKKGCHLPDCHVENVAPHWGGHRHVAESFPGHDDAGDQVGDRCAGSQEGQAHDLEPSETETFFNQRAQCASSIVIRAGHLRYFLIIFLYRKYIYSFIAYYQ